MSERTRLNRIGRLFCHDQLKNAANFMSVDNSIYALLVSTSMVVHMRQAAAGTGRGRSNGGGAASGRHGGWSYCSTRTILRQASVEPDRAPPGRARGTGRGTAVSICRNAVIFERSSSWACLDEHGRKMVRSPRLAEHSGIADARRLIAGSWTGSGDADPGQSGMPEGTLTFPIGIGASFHVMI
jgi:hypothetical protein